MISPQESLMSLIISRLVPETLSKKEVRDAIQTPEAKKLVGNFSRIRGLMIGGPIGAGAIAGGLGGAASAFVNSKTRKKRLLDIFRKDDTADDIASGATRGAIIGATATPVSAYLSNVVNAARTDKNVVDNLSKNFKIPKVFKALNKVLGGRSRIIGIPAVALAATSPFIAGAAINNYVFPRKKK